MLIKKHAIRNDEISEVSGVFLFSGDHVIGPRFSRTPFLDDVSLSIYLLARTSLLGLLHI